MKDGWITLFVIYSSLIEAGWPLPHGCFWGWRIPQVLHWLPSPMSTSPLKNTSLHFSASFILQDVPLHLFLSLSVLPTPRLHFQAEGSWSHCKLALIWYPRIVQGRPHTLLQPQSRWAPFQLRYYIMIECHLCREGFEREAGGLARCCIKRCNKNYCIECIKHFNPVS